MSEIASSRRDEKTTLLNLDFGQSVAVRTADVDWVASPAGGVERKPLERAAAESGHVTSIVRFSAQASFPAHTHPLGEEFLVLSGVFSDEDGDYGEGCYVRNPPGSRHAPFTRDGCTLFVKLDQFDPNDTARVVLDADSRRWAAGHGDLRVCALHEFGAEHVALVHWPAGEVFQSHQHWGGEEILVISGRLEDEHGSYPAGTWLRSPHLSRHHPRAPEDTLILVKTGHLLRHLESPAPRH